MLLNTNSDKCTGNKFNLYYNNVDIFPLTDWLMLWGNHNEDYFEIAGNLVRFIIDGKVYTYKEFIDNEIKYRELCYKNMEEKSNV